MSPLDRSPSYNMYGNNYAKAGQKINWEDLVFEKIKQVKLPPVIPTKKKLKWNSIRYFDLNNIDNKKRDEVQKAQLTSIKSKLSQIDEKKEYYNLLNAKKYKSKIESLKTKRLNDIVNYDIAIDHQSSLIEETPTDNKKRAITERSYIKRP